MNKSRREQLDSIITQIEELNQEEQEAYDNLPESLQNSDRGEIMECNNDRFQEAIDTLTEIN